MRRRHAGAGIAIGGLVASALMFAPAAQAADTVTNVRESEIAPTESASTYAGWHQGAQNPEGSGNWGKFQVVNEGLALIDRSQVVKGYANNGKDDLTTKNVDLAKLGDASVKVASGQISFQVPLFYKDGDTTKFTTLRSPLGGTDDIDLSDQWQASSTVGTIAKDANASISDFIGQIGGTYKVIGFGVYNEAGTSVVSDLTFDGAKYTFANNAPIAKNRSYRTKIDTAVDLNLTATDIDNNTLTYTIDGVVGGSFTGTGGRGTFTPSKGFKGDATVKYTVTDSRGGTASGTIAIKVEKLKGEVHIYRVHPARPSVRSTVYLYATVWIDGKPAPKGSTVYGYAKSKKVVSGKVNSSGKVKLKLPKKLPSGKATLKIQQAGSSRHNGGTDTIVVRVKK